MLRKYLFLILLAAAGLWLFLYIFAGGIILHRGLGRPGWPEMARDDFRIAEPMRLALTHSKAPVTAGTLVWRQVAPGYEVAELPVLMNGKEVDRVLLNRIDPKLYVFSVQTQPHKRWTISDWERELPTAALIVNGSYFGHDRLPDTPTISNGMVMGPQRYDARAGAFRADTNGATTIDLTTGAGGMPDFAGAENAFASYPLLIGDDGAPHIKRPSEWLANRSFVAEDHEGRIIVGSTQTAFLSLTRLADFLVAAPLGLKRALNLDGGPVACQSVRVGGYRRHHIARWEAQVTGPKVNLLNWAVGEADMPVVLVATPKAR
ncbi:phosphodiester glycosidase family protein [Asticcacaulis sp. BYS171W]|uniref:Phosphodiester glycosidase family protein n=1 Tax=Asticcacaulis aquaticus TaxID=2984212 RepID=A0ABT5HT13_9CAUL|nr:phosphodiester glycosidase family protein [Asticcacaulis aquaticus]MDC7683190.1 phosphodiester glycosidase family protein [Asticcacaulis aquaticus]